VLRVLSAGPTSPAASGLLRCIAFRLAVLDTLPRLLGISQVPNTSFSRPAVLSDPAEVSGSLASNGHLLLPSRHKTLSALGSRLHEAQSLHLRYGRTVAPPTLSQQRYRLPAQGWIPVGWLALIGAGISPARGIELDLAHLMEVNAYAVDH
jgi:hypothetical protein